MIIYHGGHGGHGENNQKNFKISVLSVVHIQNRESTQLEIYLSDNLLKAA